MREKVDQEVLNCFVVEAQGYLPEILQGIQVFFALPEQRESLAEAYRYAHIIRGAASLVGLDELSHVAGQLEDILESLTTGEATMTDDIVLKLCESVTQISDQLKTAASARVDAPTPSLFLESIPSAVSDRTEAMAESMPALPDLPESTEFPVYTESLASFPPIVSLLPGESLSEGEETLTEDLVLRLSESVPPIAEQQKSEATAEIYAPSYLLEPESIPTAVSDQTEAMAEPTPVLLDLPESTEFPVFTESLASFPPILLLSPGESLSEGEETLTDDLVLRLPESVTQIADQQKSDATAEIYAPSYSVEPESIPTAVSDQTEAMAESMPVLPDLPEATEFPVFTESLASFPPIVSLLPGESPSEREEALIDDLVLRLPESVTQIADQQKSDTTAEIYAPSYSVEPESIPTAVSDQTESMPVLPDLPESTEFPVFTESLASFPPIVSLLPGESPSEREEALIDDLVLRLFESVPPIADQQKSDATAEIYAPSYSVEPESIPTAVSDQTEAMAESTPALPDLPELTEFPVFTESLASFPPIVSLLPEFPEISMAESPTFADVPLPELPSFSASVVEELPSFSDSFVSAADLSEPPMAFSPVSELEIPAEPNRQEVVVSFTPPVNDEVSIELAEVFAMEAEEHLRSMSSSLQELEHQHDRKDLVQIIRRSAHSLKGSAAMVGYRDITSLAHRMEDLLDLLYEGERTLTAELVQLLFTSTYLLEDMSNGQAAPDAVAAAYSEYARLLDVDVADAVVAGQEAPAANLLQPAADSEVVVSFTPPVRDQASIELAEVFAMEAEEHLRSMSSSLQVLEHEYDRKDLVQTIRRSAHSLKGSAAMVGYRDITNLAHRMEDLLDLLYEGERTLTAELVQLLFTSTYLLEDMSNGQAAPEAVATAYSEYARLLGVDTTAAVVAGQEAPAADLPQPATDLNVVSIENLLPAVIEQSSSQPMQRAATSPSRTGQVVRVPLESLDELVKLVSELVITQTQFEQGMSDLGVQLAELQSSSSRMRRVSSKLETQYEASTLGGGRSIGPVAVTTGRSNNSSVTWNTHGFDALEFDRYTEFHLLSREMTETTSDLDTVSGEFHSLASDFDTYLNRQTRLFSDIQDRLMRVRMVPLSNIASRLHRIVRHVARKQGKQVELVLEGEETGLDKTVLEEIVDPLQHLLRNAVDHGMELPDIREANGKPARGRIHLRAFYEGTQVVVQLSDDGRGLDLDRIRAEAINGGYVAAADLPAMSEQELFALVFTPGFSTSPQVSEISGRGVGLDVVRDAVHKLKGTVAIESVGGKGTTFTIRLPMTLAVIKALFVNSSNQTYAIPLSVVTQILRLEQGTVEEIGKETVLRVKGQVYPLMYLNKLLNSRTAAETQMRRPPVLIVSIEGKKIALVVDELMGGREIVIKNLANHLRGVTGVMGATLMGDGSVVLILNLADFVRESARPVSVHKNVIAMPTAVKRETLTVMIVDDSPSVRRVSTNLVKSAGWSPLQAKDGLEALDILHELETLPDLMLLDIEMPRMDGYELLSTLRSQDAYRNLPVVIVTSRASDKHRQKAFAAGATEYLVKPYQDEMLLSLIRRLVRENRRELA